MKHIVIGIASAAMLFGAYCLIGNTIGRFPELFGIGPMLIAIFIMQVYSSYSGSQKNG